MKLKNMRVLQKQPEMVLIEDTFVLVALEGMVLFNTKVFIGSF